MAVPATRNEFKEYCLRKLGKPVIEINVDDDQLEDRIDQALKYYADYHFDGSQTEYYKHLITETDKTNKFVTVPNDIMGVIRIFPIGDPASRSNDLFNIRYQIALNELYNLTSVSMTPYFIARTHLSLIQEILVGKQPIRYNRHTDRIYVDMDWQRMLAGEYLLFEVYRTLDPDTYPDVWSDRWLQEYSTALIKQQWGMNLTKFTGMQLPGGVSFNGERILSDAQGQISQLESEMITSYSLPVSDMIG